MANRPSESTDWLTCWPVGTPSAAAALHSRDFQQRDSPASADASPFGAAAQGATQFDNRFWQAVPEMLHSIHNPVSNRISSEPRQVQSISRRRHNLSPEFPQKEVGTP